LWEVVVSVFLSKIYMYMCPTLNSFRDRAISLYICKIIAKGLLRIVSNIGIYCSSDKVGTFYPLQYIIQNSTVNSHALCNSCKDMACRSSEFITTLFYPGDIIHYLIAQFVLGIHFCFVHFTLHPTL